MNKQISLYIAMAVAIVLPFLPSPAVGQAEYEEITVSFEVPRLLTHDLFVRYDGKTLYLPVVEVFGYLDINIGPDPVRTRGVSWGTLKATYR